MNLSEFQALKSTYDEAVKTGAKSLVAELFKKFFDEQPAVEMATWVQYTPYFNDGDACVFSIHEPGFKLAAEETSGGEVDEDESDLPSYWSFKEQPDLQAAMKGLYLETRNLGDLFETAFGDGYRVKAYRDGRFTVDEYSHD